MPTKVHQHLQPFPNMLVDASFYEEFREPGTRFTSVEKINVASQIVAALRRLSGEGSPDLALCSKLLTEQPFQHSVLIEAFYNKELHKLEGTRKSWQSTTPFLFLTVRCLALICDDASKWHPWRESTAVRYRRLLVGTQDDHQRCFGVYRLSSNRCMKRKTFLYYHCMGINETMSRLSIQILRLIYLLLPSQSSLAQRTW